jgi:hypothetical protein
MYDADSAGILNPKAKLNKGKTQNPASVPISSASTTYRDIANPYSSNKPSSNSNSGSNGGSGAKSTTLRDYLGNLGYSVDYDASTDEVIIGGKRYKAGAVPGTSYDSEAGIHYVTNPSAISVALGGSNSSPYVDTDKIRTQIDKANQTTQNAGQQYSFPYEELLRDLFGQTPTYKPPTQDEMLELSKQWANLQISPLLAAIQNSVTDSQAAYDTGIGQVNAAYAGVPAQINQYLAEADRLAQEDAIRRNMGRSGVVNWERDKRQAPILAQAAQTEQEKAAKIAELANKLAAAKAKAANLTTEAETRRGNLEAARLADLQNIAAQLSMQQDANKWGQGLSLANLATNSNNAQLEFEKWLTLMNLNG